MSANLDYAQGRLASVLSSKDVEMPRKFLAIIFQGDPHYSIQLIHSVISAQSLDEKARMRGRILLSALLLTRGHLDAAKRQFANVSLALEMQEPDQWNAFYKSTGHYLAQIFKQVESLPAAAHSRPQAVVIGDSHVLGMAAASSADLEKIYIPTVTIRQLASPQNNAVKVAFANAIALTYRQQRVIFSVGEIDSRGFTGHIDNDRHYWRKSKEKWSGAIDAAYSYLANLKNPLQEFAVIIPPMPSERIANNKFAENEDKLQALIGSVKELRELCMMSADKYQLKIIQYDDDIWSANNLCASIKLVDHAHFTIDVYRNLVEKCIE